MRQVNLKQRQNGAVLAVGLIILLVMTLIGVSTIGTTVMQEHMNGNVRDRQLAFHAAESALREGEAFIETVVSTAAFNGTNGLYGTSDTEPDPYGTWDSNNSREYQGTQLEGVATDPRYRIRLIGEFGESSGSLNIGRYGELRAEAPATGFYITARGTGGSDNSVVVIRSYYGRRISN